MFGIIKTLNSEKKFGFISQTDDEGKATGAKDVFFHMTALQDVGFGELSKGDRVTFDVEETEKGLRASDVRLA